MTSRLGPDRLAELERLAKTEVAVATCACPESPLDSQAHQKHRQLVDPTIPRATLLALVTELRVARDLLQDAGLGHVLADAIAEAT